MPRGWLTPPRPPGYRPPSSCPYQVLAAFYIDVSLSEDGVAFPFYEYTGLRDEAIFQEYLAQVGDRALYSTGVTAEFGEQLLTLSTCSYNTSDERFVVVAKQVV